MLSSVEATRLATSPILATIAKGETNFATQENLKAYFDTAKTVKMSTAKSSSAPTGIAGDGGSAVGEIFLGGIDIKMSEDVNRMSFAAQLSRIASHSRRRWKQKALPSRPRPAY